MIWSRTDWGLFIGGLGLSLVGALLVWSATRHQTGSEYLARHLLNTGIGITVALATPILRPDQRDPRHLRQLISGPAGHWLPDPPGRYCDRSVGGKVRGPSRDVRPRAASFRS